MKTVQIRLEVTVDGETLTYMREEALELFHLPHPGEPIMRRDTTEFSLWDDRMRRRNKLIESLGVYVAEAIHHGLDVHMQAEKQKRIRSIAK